jgi:hypothetical protein
MKRALFLACALELAACTGGLGADKDTTKGKKVDVIVQSWALPGTLGNDLKSGTSVTGVVISHEGEKAALSEVVKGSGDRPREGGYYHQKMTVYKGKKYAAHDVYLSAALPEDTRLKEFSFRGTFTGRFGDAKAHKYSHLEAQAVAP